MTDWRYWITYSGSIKAADEKDAEQIALASHLEFGGFEVDVEPINEPVEVEAIDNAGN